MNIYDGNIYEKAYRIVSVCSSKQDRIREGVTMQGNVGRKLRVDGARVTEHILSLSRSYIHNLSLRLWQNHCWQVLHLVHKLYSRTQHSGKTINENHMCTLSTCKLFRQSVHRILLAALLTYARNNYKLLAAISSTTTHVC